MSGTEEHFQDCSRAVILVPQVWSIQAWILASNLPQTTKKLHWCNTSYKSKQTVCIEDCSVVFKTESVRTICPNLQSELMVARLDVKPVKSVCEVLITGPTCMWVLITATYVLTNRLNAGATVAEIKLGYDHVQWEERRQTLADCIIDSRQCIYC